MPKNVEENRESGVSMTYEEFFEQYNLNACVARHPELECMIRQQMAACKDRRLPHRILRMIEQYNLYDRWELRELIVVETAKLLACEVPVEKLRERGFFLWKPFMNVYHYLEEIGRDESYIVMNIELFENRNVAQLMKKVSIKNNVLGALCDLYASPLFIESVRKYFRLDEKFSFDPSELPTYADYSAHAGIGSVRSES